MKIRSGFVSNSSSSSFILTPRTYALESKRNFWIYLAGVTDYEKIKNVTDVEFECIKKMVPDSDVEILYNDIINTKPKKYTINSIKKKIDLHSAIIHAVNMSHFGSIHTHLLAAHMTNMFDVIDDNIINEINYTIDSKFPLLVADGMFAVLSTCFDGSTVGYDTKEIMRMCNRRYKAEGCIIGGFVNLLIHNGILDLNNIVELSYGSDCGYGESIDGAEYIVVHPHIFMHNNH